ncbi:MAG: ABC transporter ATP-binding protein [Bacteroidota bacterium]|nr:ABC transporter ATP-binding protein [Bacteroidota bacterium]
MAYFSKNTKAINIGWVFSVHTGWFSFLSMASIMTGFESILILSLLASNYSRSILIVAMIVLIRILKFVSPFTTLDFQNRIDQAFDYHFFDLSKSWSLLKIRKPEFYHKFSKALQQSEIFTHQILYGLLPGITQSVTMFTLLLWFSHKNTNFTLLLPAIVGLEIISLLIKSGKTHEHSVQNLELFREYSYLKYQLVSHRSLREFQAYGTINSLKISCLEKLREFQKTKLDLLRSNSLVTITVRTIQFIGILFYFKSGGHNIHIKEFSIEELGLAYAIFRVFSSGAKMAGLAGHIAAIRLSAREINNLAGEFESQMEGSSLCSQLIADFYSSHKKNIICLSGDNGSGKSSLILELIDHRQKFSSLQTGILFQDFTLFQGSILNNILLFSMPPDKHDQLNHALESSGFYECMQKYGWNLETRIGEEFSKGRGISMGEWQKLALARAIYHGQDLLVLDEPETFLDIKSRQKLLRFIAKSNIPTIILISHANEFKQLAHESIKL